MSDIETAGQLFDLCQELFGIGGYDDDATTEPFYRVRMREIAKINSFVRKRDLEYKTLGIAARYCHEHGIRIEGTGGLIKHIGPALMEMRHKEALAKRVEIEETRSRLINIALEKGDEELAQQLMRIELRVGMSRAVFEFAANRLGVEL